MPQLTTKDGVEDTPMVGRYCHQGFNCENLVYFTTRTVERVPKQSLLTVQL